MLKKCVLFLFCMIIFSLSAGITRQENYHGKKVYTLENEKLILRIDPSLGGKAVSFYLKDRKQELVKFGKDEGFFIDHWSKFQYPSGLMHLPYQAEFLKMNGAAAVRMQLKVPAYGGGQGARNRVSSLKIPTDKELKDLLIIKTIILKDSSDVVTVNMELKNPTNESRSAAFHFQHGFRVTPDSDRYRWDMPSIDGFAGPALKPGIKMTGKTFINDPVAGWFSVSDLQNFNMVFEFDWNYLDRTYSCGITGEWMMENIILSGGKSFRTVYKVYPVSGMERIAYAKDGIVAGIKADETSKGVKVTVNLTSKSAANRNDPLKLRVRAVAHKDKRILAEKTFNLSKLNSEIQSFVLESPVKEEMVIKAELEDKTGLRRSFEYHYVDEKAEFNNRFFYGTMGAGAAVLAGGRGSAYRMKAPPKIKKMDLPDFNKIKKFPNDKNRMLVLFGLYTDHLKIYETFRNDPATEITWCNANPRGVSSFPASFDELFRYRTIFMCNVNYKSLRFEGFEMIRHWIAQGGTLVVTGGFYTYGAGEFEGSPFEQYVPFKNLKPFELCSPGKRKSFVLKVTGKDPVLAGVDFSASPDVPWLHKMQLKPGAEVLAVAGPHPAIVKMKYGKGVVIACTMTPLGNPAKPFWLGDAWKKFLVNCSKLNKN
ncbi:MAG: hypothetical protein E7040_08665 [Lentisphaerae bacterium]|nr:hypothetical protein [Lentisphaerota bacterium]